MRSSMRPHAATVQRTGTLLLALLVLMPPSGFAGEARVQLVDGLVSATFEATRAADALEAIRGATGTQVVLLASVQTKTLTLSVKEVPFEPFLKRVLDALDLGGFALVYDPHGTADRLIVVDRARGDEDVTTLGTPEKKSPPAAEAGGRPPERAQLSVPILVPKTHAAFMNLGAPGQVIVVHSTPVARTRTTECDGTSADYPVQTALVIDGTSTYLTSLIVCAAGGLKVGDQLAPPPTPLDARIEADSAYARYQGTTRYE